MPQRYPRRAIGNYGMGSKDKMGGEGRSNTGPSLGVSYSGTGDSYVALGAADSIPTWEFKCRRQGQKRGRAASHSS